MMDFMGPVGMMMDGAAGFSGPSVSITSSDFGSGGVFIGYARPGGYTASTIGASGGSLSATILTGFVTDGVIAVSGGDNSIVIVGDAVAALAGLSAITIGGVPCAVSTPPAYDAVNSVTIASFDGSAALVASTTQTIQLV